MTLSYELKNELSNIYWYYYENFYEDHNSKSAQRFFKKIDQIRYDKFYNFSKAELSKVGNYYLDNFDINNDTAREEDKLSEREQKQLAIVKPYLLKRGIRDF